MKAKSRKRLLISSIAMLLVAMLALGTATFAWFTQDTTATADTVYAQTVKASSLQITDKSSPTDSDWGTYINYGLGSKSGNDITYQTMFPASSGDGTNWFTAVSDAEHATTGTRVGNATPVTPTATNPKYVFKSMLNVRNGGDEGSIENVKITLSWGTSPSDYARIALVPAKVDGTFATNADFTTSVYDTEGESYKGQLTVNTETSSNITGKTTTTINIGTGTNHTLDAGQAEYYVLFIWFEGQDADCIDTNAGQKITNFTFTVTGDPV